MQVVKHELTHYIELSDNYGKFDSFVTKQVLNTLEENNSSRTIEAIEADIVADYKARGKELTPEQAHHEFIAKYVEEQLFKSQDAVKSLVNYDFAAAKDIHSWLQRTIAKLKGESVSIERLTKAEKMFAQALSEVSKLNSDEVLQRAEKEKFIDGADKKYIINP